MTASSVAPTSTPRVVYLIMSYKNPEQVGRLVRALGRCNEGSHIVIHHDPQNPDARLSLDGLDRVHFAPAAPVFWGDFTMVEAVLRSLSWIERSIDYDWVVLLSGQDYPIKPLQAIEETLGRSEFDGYLPHGLRTITVEMIDRYRLRYVAIPGGSSVRRLAERLAPWGGRWESIRRGRRLVRLVTTPPLLPPRTLLGVARLKTPFSADFPCRVSLTWFMIRRRCVQAIESFVRERPDFVKHYRYTFIPEESFVPTILLNDSRLRIANYPLRFMRQKAAAHPDILTLADLDDLAKSPALFARKFDTSVDAGVLDALDERIGTNG